MLALIDCNNFYASCETLFNPRFRNRPVVVLSNNDGCVIARSKEAKLLNIKMGSPIFEYRELVQKKIIYVFSSNFTLYGDMSMRVMKTLETFLFPMEIYSIDEAFLLINKENMDLAALAKDIKEKVREWTGIDVSVGMAKTKTLAKLASELAKKQNGIFILNNKSSIEDILKKTPLENIWGIGSKLKKRLYRLGIFSAYGLTQADELLIKKHLSVNVLKTALELKETKCFGHEENPSSKKSICTSRSFAGKIDNLTSLEMAVSSFAAIAAEKLRKQKTQTNFITVFIMTGFHSKDPFYANHCQMSLPVPTSYTPDLIAYAKKGLSKIYKEGFLYKKAGVILSDFTDENSRQQDLFSGLNDEDKKFLMRTMDNINRKANKKAVFFASEGLEKKYKSSFAMKSLRFTTSFDELIKAK